MHRCKPSQRSATTTSKNRWIARTKLSPWTTSGHAPVNWTSTPRANCPTWGPTASSKSPISDQSGDTRPRKCPLKGTRRRSWVLCPSRRLCEKFTPGPRNRVTSDEKKNFFPGFEPGTLEFTCLFVYENRPPLSAMTGDTTYSMSYLENCAERQKPIRPETNYVFPFGGQFVGRSIYNESFIHSRSEPVIPVIPKETIKCSSAKMDDNTTHKV